MNKNIWIWAFLNERSYSESKWHYSITNHEGMEEQGWVLVEKRSIEFQVPDEKELTIKTVEAMRAHLQNMRAKHSSEEALLEERINNLLAIEYRPEAANA